MSTMTATRRSIAAQGDLLRYFLLVFGLAAPFWLLGGGKLPLPINLPVSALATFVPVTAAAIAAYWRSGFKGAGDLLRRAVDYRKIKNGLWYLPVLFLIPLVNLTAYAVMRLTGMALPESVQIPLLELPVFLVLFLIGDTGEELGWTGFATDPMQGRWGAFKGSLLLGLVWVVWHAIPWVQTGNSLAWIAWQALFSIALRVLMVWMYNHTGKSVFAATLLHVSGNMGWAFFPNHGSHYNPMLTALITVLAAGIILLVDERQRKQVIG